MSEKTGAWVPTSVLAEALGVPKQAETKKKEATLDLDRTGGEWSWSLCWVLSGNVCGTAPTPLKVQVIDSDKTEFHGKTVEIPTSLLQATPAVLANPTELDADQTPPPNDLITLTHLHEASVVHCLKKRYEHDVIYTSTGPILIALNPFKNLPHLYNDETMGSYWAAGEHVEHACQDLAPHVFGSAHAAFRKMMEGIELKTIRGLRNVTADQSMLVSGESGAGKTVTTKHIMKYLATLSQRKAEHVKRCRAASPGRSEGNAPSRRSSAISLRRMSRDASWKAGAVIEEKVLESNPILEAFGNARTVRNDNSSRFGKFIELQFKQSGSLIGASIETYLLEKVRLIHQNAGERNFHIFYELLAAATPEERESYHLNALKAQDFKLTSASGTFDRRDGADDAELFDNLVLSMGTMGFEPQTQEDIFAVTVAFLHASNVTFDAVTDDSSKVSESSNPSVQPMLKLLGLDLKEFQSAMCEFEIETGIDSYRRQVNQELAVKGLEAFIKGTYGAMFAFLVQTINKKIDFKPHKGVPAFGTKAASISVLDIFGFESVANNSFEQLCINYCNETLQQQFNLFIFKSEQDEYRREGIEWEFIQFPDNQDVIDLIERKGEGLIPLLTDQCRTNRGNDKSFLEAACKFSGPPRFEASPLQKASGQFIVHHYAGPVLYSSDGFVEKNKDEIPRATSVLLQSSSNSFVQLLGKIISPSIGDRPAKRPTIGSQFASQLNELRKRIEQTTPHYVRCLKPNQNLQADQFNKAMVADQLRYAGVLEAIRVSRSGYSQRYSYDSFVERYRFIALEELKAAAGGDLIRSVDILVSKVAELMWKTENPNEAPPGNLFSATGVQKGKSKVFLRQSAFDYIERFRSEKLSRCAAKIQSGARRCLAYRHFLVTKRRVILVQACARRHKAGKIMIVVRRRKAATKIQTRQRGVVVRRKYLAKKKAAKWCQKRARGIKGRKIYREKLAKKQEEIARNNLQYKSAVSIQCMYRSNKARKEVSALMAQKQEVDKTRQALLSAEEEERLRKLEEEHRKAQIAADRAAAVAKEVSYEKDKEVTDLKNQLDKATNAAVVAKSAQDELRLLKAELDQVKAELAAKTEVAEHSASRVAELEEENKKLKKQVKEGGVVVDDYSNSSYDEHGDLKQLDERIHGLAMRSKQSKKDLEALVQSLFILR